MIVPHPTTTHKGTFGLEPSYCMKCDFCQRLAPPGDDLHQAVEKAYSAAFSTVPGAALTDPKQWSCPGCRRSA